jgi:hypothetical protein
MAIYRTPFPKRLRTLPSISFGGYFRGCLQTRNREQNTPTFASEEEGVGWNWFPSFENILRVSEKRA